MKVVLMNHGDRSRPTSMCWNNKPDGIPHQIYTTILFPLNQSSDRTSYSRCLAVETYGITYLRSEICDQDGMPLAS